MGLIDLVFPRACLGCGKEGVYICKNCLENIPEAKLVCPECQRPSVDGLTHVRCRRKFGLDGLTFLWGYKGVIRKAILSLKYKYASEIAKDIANFATERLKEGFFPFPNDLALIPIPAHFLRFNLRGFNQTEEVGRIICKNMNWNFKTDFLIRKRLRVPQVELKRNERQKNVKGVFCLNSKIEISRANFFLLFDDVFTTGSTLKEAAKVLKRCGAKVVWGFTLAR